MLVAQSCPSLRNAMDWGPARLLGLWDFTGKNTGVGCHFLLQGIFQTPGSNLGLPHCSQALYCLSHWGRLLSYGCDCFRKDPWHIWLFLKYAKKRDLYFFIAIPLTGPKFSNSCSLFVRALGTSHRDLSLLW